MSIFSIIILPGQIIKYGLNNINSPQWDFSMMQYLFDYMTVKDNLLLGTFNVKGNSYINLGTIYELFPILKERENHE